MKQQKRRTTPYERRLYNYNQEKQRLLQKNPFAPPEELERAIKKLADEYRI